MYDYEDEMFKDLIGHVIGSMSMADDGQEFSITFKDRKVAKFGVEGDCCSSSWIEHLEIPADIDGAKLLSVDEPSMPMHDNHVCDGDYEKGCGHDSLAVYHTRFRTDKGDVVLEYRNDSNGYYGGNLFRIPVKA